MTERAQSELVGNILLIGVVVLVATAVSIGITTNLTNSGVSSDETVRVNLLVDVTPTNLTLTHNGGSELTIGDVRIRLSTASGSTEFSMDAANVTGGDTYEAGDVFHRAHGLSGDTMTVVVIDTDSNAVILDTTESVD